MAEKIYLGLFIDFENLYYSIYNNIIPERAIDFSIKIIENTIEYFSTENQNVIYRRAFADFENLSGVQSRLSIINVRPIYVLTRKGKNSADLELSLDMLSQLLTNDLLDTFILIGGDKDYIPIVRKVKENGKEIYLIGTPGNTTAGDLRKVVGDNYFISSEELVEEIKEIINEKNEKILKAKTIYKSYNEAKEIDYRKEEENEIYETNFEEKNEEYILEIQETEEEPEDINELIEESQYKKNIFETMVYCIHDASLELKKYKWLYMGTIIKYHTDELNYLTTSEKVLIIETLMRAGIIEKKMTGYNETGTPVHSLRLNYNHDFVKKLFTYDDEDNGYYKDKYNYEEDYE